MAKRGVLVTLFCVSFLIYTYLHITILSTDLTSLDTNSIRNQQPKPILPVYRSNHTVWVSMGLCYDQHTQILGKRTYPYAEVTPMAIKLWKHFRPNVNIYLKIIYFKEPIEIPRQKYHEVLLSAGANVVEWIPASKAGNLSCVLQSQLSRLFIYENLLVKPTDIVITVDVNLFVTASHILEPIDKFPHRRAWIFQYEDTAYIDYGWGETFNQNLLGMPAKEWEMLLNAPEGLTEAWLHAKQDEIGLDKSQTWYYDQWITTYGLLKNKICNVPPTSGLWKNKDLVFDPKFNDSLQCWHGSGYKDCNIDIHIVKHGCKWYHFYPFETFQDHLDKFNELTNYVYDIQLSDMYNTVKPKPRGTRVP